MSKVSSNNIATKIEFFISDSIDVANYNVAN
jgi:hypothetical protein